MRNLSIRWIGPFPYQHSFYVVESGLYLVFGGQSLLYAGGSTQIGQAMGSHISYDQGRVKGKDLEGRDFLHCSRSYGTVLRVKLGTVHDLDTGEQVSDQAVFDDLISAFVYLYRPNSNTHGRERYGGHSAMSVRNVGKKFPLDSSFEIAPEITDSHR